MLAGVTEKIIRHEMAQSVAKPRREKGRPVFGPNDVAFFRLVANLPFELDKSARRDLFEVIARRTGHKGSWRLIADRLLLEGEVSAELMTADLVEEVTAAFSRFIKSKSRVVSRDEIQRPSDVEAHRSLQEWRGRAWIG